MVCISRFIYPDTYSPVSTHRPIVLLPLAKYPGVRGSRSDKGIISRKGVNRLRAKTYKRPSSADEFMESKPFRSGELGIGRGTLVTRVFRAKAAECHNDILYRELRAS